MKNITIKEILRNPVRDAVPFAPSSVPTWWIAERCGISHAKADRELRKLESAGEIVKLASAVNRSTLKRFYWRRAEASAAQGDE